MSDTLSEDRQLVKTLRITLALVGIAALGFGIAILVWPGKVAQLMVGFIAAYMILAGLIYIGLGLFAKQRGGWARIGHLVLGLIYIAAGIFIFVNLTVATAWIAIFFTVIVGITWIIDGVVALSLIGDAASKVWTIIYALLSVAGGVVLLMSPIFGAVVLWWIVGISLVVIGLMQIVRAFTIGGAVKAASA